MSRADGPSIPRTDDPVAALPTDAQRLVASIAPVLDAIGASLLDRDGQVLAGQSDVGGDREVPLMWEGRLIGIVRLAGLQDALSQLVSDVETQLGAPLHELGRTGKQRAVHLLDRRGAFVVRRAVDEVAALLEVSRFTVYNYLNRDDREATDEDAANPTTADRA